VDSTTDQRIELRFVDTLTQVVFPAMGNTVNLTVIGDDELVVYSRKRISELERLWSRFVTSSDISRLNRAEGRSTPVHPDTITLVRYLVDAQRVTNGLFDPTITPSLNKIGYSASRTNSQQVCELPKDTQSHVDLTTTTIDERFGAVTLPHRATLDPGGLGKGLAADLVARELMGRGATGVCLSIGGDIRCAGAGPIDGSWLIVVAHPTDPSRTLGTIRLNDGAVATSSVHAKRWFENEVEHHHVIEPTYGAPLTIDQDSIIQSSVIAAEAVWAEVFATMSLVGKNELVDHDLACLTVRSNGSTHANARWKEFDSE